MNTINIKCKPNFINVGTFSLNNITIVNSIKQISYIKHNVFVLLSEFNTFDLNARFVNI